ncbi:SdrD B-like domain-containing protein, partial [Thomasclavelia sp.]|uniref:SdrD B-like domain-containing protein n=1 Tax=Thomasclavelia sp. TaxID=3025757 RepID=UPI0025DD9FC4
SDCTGDQAIVNIPTKGRFSFTKTKPNGTGLPGATFQLLKEVNGTYQNVFEEFTVDDENGEFLSNIIDPGNYQLKEVKAPDGFEISEPINFTVAVGKVTFVTSPGEDTVINQALGTIKLTKYNDQSSYLNIDNKPLANVEFGLYQENDQLVISKKTDQKGQIVFEDVPAGKYYVREIKGLTGYQENNKKYPVTVKANQNEVIEYLPEVKDGKNGVIINKSNMGRLVIKKVASDDNKGLSGAVFKISKVNDTSFVPVEITSYKDGLAISDLLPANSTGSKYLVEEIKAPDGYSLDDKYFATKQEVTVYPLQDQEVILSKDNPDGRNYLVFKNYKIANIMDIDQEISKYIDDNGDLIQTKTVNTPLLDSKDVEKFTIRDYADGQNDVPVSKVVVEDTNMQLYYLDANNDYVPVDPSDPYTIDAVTIYHASDKLGNNLKARIYYQGEGSANWQTRDDLVVDVPDANQNIKVELDDLKATKIKVEYYNENGLISEGFKAEGIDLDVTINKRPSDATANEIRQVTNDAKVIYHYSYKDETGTNQNAIYENVTSKVNIFYPLNETTLPKVSLGIVSGEANKIYKPGDSIESTITVINKTETDDPDGTIIQPIISFDLPVGMSLNTNSYTVDDLTGQTTNFQVVVYNEEDATSGILLEPSKYQVVYDLIEAREFIDGKLVNTGKQTRKITILLDEEFAFKPNMKITIKYMGTTSINDTSTVLSTPAYFTSGVTTALSIENPYGNSFTVETSSGSSANTLVDDKTLDEITGRDQIDTTGTGLKYPFSVGEIIINETNYLSIYKQVKGIYNDDWLNYNQIASTAPGEDLDYQIIFKNGGDDNQSDRAISKARVVDILPFAGDSLVNRTDDNYTARSTTLAKSPILRYVDVLKDEKDFNYTLYYCVGNDVSSKFDQWKEEQRTKYTAQEELPIVYNDTWSDDDWNSGKHQWVKASEYTGDLNLVSAFAIEFDFSNDLLEPGEAVTIQIKMAAPEYTTDEIEEVEGKYMANSALIAVQRFGSDTISKSDITENREVKAKLTLPKGTIGDYVWYDLNRNGIQDDSDIPVQGLMITLHKYVTTYDDEGKLVRLEIFSDDEFTTRSDSYGHYEFTNQDCNVLKSGKTDANSKNPNDYVGDRYYEYRVEFAIPEDESTYTYVPTKRYALDENGKRQNEIDSNIGDDQTKVGDQASDDDEYCFSEYFALTATKLGDASLAGETNLTLDAGFIAKGSLGDYVWFDANKNGIQDPDETGVADVTVRLYQADENGNIIDNQALATTKTDRYGYYLFADLIEGNYIVEFDISDVVPKVGGGYLDRYYFSANNATDDQEYDSNPIIDAANQDTMVARTDLITLEYHSSDMSIDAGLTVYSALSGVVFEDRDYSDIQNYYDEKENEIDTILVPGTIVTLYQVSEEFDIINALPDESWIVGQTTVGEDGKYYFDKLDNGYYVVKFTFPEGYSIASGDVGDDDTIDSDVVNQIETVDNRVSGYTNVIEIGLNEVVSNVDGGARLYSALGDYVFNDNNSNGIQDEGDSPIAGVTVYLFKRESEDGSWQYYRQTVTDEEGYYLFTNLEGSTYTKIDYRVIFDLGITTKITIPYAGDDQALDSNALNQYIPGFGYPTDPIDLAYNTVDLTWDAGVVQSRGAIGDYVWYDSNVNGIQDEEGTGIGGIKVVLETNTGDITNEDDWQEVAVTYTNEQGYYIFNNLKEGYYRVKFEVPANYNVTLSSQGEDGAIDSDGIYFNDDTYYYTRSFYLDQDGYDMTWDLGVYDPTVTTTTITTTVDSSTDGIMTGDDKVIFGYVILAALSLITAYGLNRKRKQLIKRQ